MLQCAPPSPTGGGTCAGGHRHRPAAERGSVFPQDAARGLLATFPFFRFLTSRVAADRGVCGQVATLAAGLGGGRAWLRQLPRPLVWGATRWAAVPSVHRSQREVTRTGPSVPTSPVLIPTTSSPLSPLLPAARVSWRLGILRRNRRHPVATWPAPPPRWCAR